MRRRHELTNAQWEQIRDLLPGKAGGPGRTASDNRLFVDAVIYVLKTGIPWEDLPARYGKPNSVWKRFDRWCASGVWERIAQALGEPDLEEVQLDSSTIKAHPVASTGRRWPQEKKTQPTRDAVEDAVGADSPPSFTPPLIDEDGCSSCTRTAM